jgi:propanol-preferring alcohol dehydrogenase
VLLKVMTAGICSSDLTVIGWPEEQFPYPLPMALGHNGRAVVLPHG